MLLGFSLMPFTNFQKKAPCKNTGKLDPEDGHMFIEKFIHPFPRTKIFNQTKVIRRYALKSYPDRDNYLEIRPAENTGKLPGSRLQSSPYLI